MNKQVSLEIFFKNLYIGIVQIKMYMMIIKYNCRYKSTMAGLGLGHALSKKTNHGLVRIMEQPCVSPSGFIWAICSLQ